MTCASARVLGDCGLNVGRYSLQIQRGRSAYCARLMLNSASPTESFATSTRVRPASNATPWGLLSP
eukprot:10806800-Lingulodinium_polyedra.AAC.1